MGKKEETRETEKRRRDKTYFTASKYRIKFAQWLLGVILNYHIYFIVYDVARFLFVFVVCCR